MSLLPRFALMVFALTSTLSSASEAPAYAEITFFRPYDFAGGAVYSIFWVNNEPIASFRDGQVTVSVVPGSHRIQAGSTIWCGPEDFGSADCEMSEMTSLTTTAVTLAAGEKVWYWYNIHTGNVTTFNTRPQKLDDIDTIYQPINHPITSRVASPAESALIRRCRNAASDVPCELYLQRFPDGEFTQEAQSRGEQYAQQRSREQALSDSRLPPEARRDALMLQLAQLLKSNEHAQALPLFARLQALPVPLDANLNYFWGRSLILAGEPDAGVDRLVRYLNAQGREAAKYREALALLNEVDLSP